MKKVWHHTKHYSKKTTVSGSRFLFPYLWHYYTDHYDNRIHHLIVDAVISIFLVSLLAVNASIAALVYVYSITPDFAVEIHVEDSVVSGSDLQYSLRYTNSVKAVSNVRIELLTPAGLQIADDEDVIELGTVARNADRTIHLSNRFTGNINANQRIIAQYNYTYYGRSFTGIAYAEFTPRISSFEIVPTGPEKILNSEELNYTIDYINSSDHPRYGTCITVDLPLSFVLSVSEPELSDDSSVCFEELGARESGSINIRGTFTNAIGEGKQVITAIATDSANDMKFVQAEIPTDIRVLTPRFTLNLQDALIQRVGEAVQYAHTYTNTGDAPLRNVRISTTISNNEGEFSGVSAVDGSIAGNVASWVDPEILPGETHTRYLRGTITPSWRVKNESFNLTTNASAEIDDLGIQTYTLGDSTEVKLASTLAFAVLQKYYGPHGEQIGYGPLPMQPNEVTALRVFWEIRDFTNDLTDVAISTTLPSQVEWTGITSVTEGSAIQYNASTRTVTWSTSSIESFAQPQGAQFEVRVLPNWQQVGSRINITNDTAFSARDSYTGTVIRQGAGPLRTTDAVVAPQN